MELVGSGRTEKLRLEAGKSNNFVRKTKRNDPSIKHHAKV